MIRGIVAHGNKKIGKQKKGNNSHLETILVKILVLFKKRS